MPEPVGKGCMCGHERDDHAYFNDRGLWTVDKEAAVSSWGFCMKCADARCERYEARDGWLPTQRQMLDFVRERWPATANSQGRLNKLGEEYGEVVGAFVKMHDGTGRKTFDDFARELAQMVIVAFTAAECMGFDLLAEVADEWQRSNQRVWPQEAPHA